MSLWSETFSYILAGWSGIIKTHPEWKALMCCGEVFPYYLKPHSFSQGTSCFCHLALTSHAVLRNPFLNAVRRAVKGTAHCLAFHRISFYLLRYKSSAFPLLVPYSTQFYQVSDTACDIGDPQRWTRKTRLLLCEVDSLVWRRRTRSSYRHHGKAKVIVGHIKSRAEMKREKWQRKCPSGRPLISPLQNVPEVLLLPEEEPRFWTQFSAVPLNHILLDAHHPQSCFLESITWWARGAPGYCASQLWCDLHHSQFFVALALAENFDF